MTISNAKYANIWRTSGSKPPFSGWQIDDQLSYLLKDGDSPYIRNARIDGSGTVIRPGYIQFSTTLSGTGTYPNGIASYLRSEVKNQFKNILTVYVTLCKKSNIYFTIIM